MKKSLRIEFAGGGTGGHLFPAISLADEFRRRFPSCEILFWGTKHGIEFRLKNRLQYSLNTIWIRGFRRAFVLSNLIIPFELLGSFIRMTMHIIFHRPDVVIGTGGYVSGPVVFVASRLGIPTVVQEQNSYPGVTTRLLARWVKRVYLTYESSRTYFKNQEKIRVFGNPVRKFDLERKREQALQKFNLKADRKTLFAFGGSQGGLGINNLMLEITSELLKTEKLQILWATGPSHFEQIKTKLGEMKGLHLIPFIENMDDAYRASDIVVCRSGATTIAELTFMGVPAIFIPFPFATGGHQEYNARELEKQNAAVCLLQDETSGEQLFHTILTLIEDGKKLSEMQKNMKKLARSNAAHDIVSDICDHILAGHEN